MTAAEKAEWNRVRKEPRTVEDWRDLHDTIEAYKRRLMQRHAERGRKDRADGS